ncbi:PAS domain-containing sensor histidine kinase [Methanoculleus sp.]|uniref:PAS domain-containing sensor histidine kinase n=1 Tax=Methanoculleus sp. TaxID=90427 RepID=UPI001BD58F8B|nr:PAS domain-containing sensor histidine kinase [Methanoculleus sp.]
MNPPCPLPPEVLSALAVLDALGEGALLIDRTNRVAWVNHPLECLLGIDKNAFCSSDIDRFVRRYLTPRVTDGESTARIAALLSSRDDIAGLACTIRTSGNRERRFLISSNGIREGSLQGNRIVRFRDITDLKRAEQELLKYLTVFGSVDSGFCIVEMIFHADGRPADYRFLETNRAFERLTGLSDVAGKTMRELAPGHEEHWFEIFGAVARTGESRRFVQAVKYLIDRWYEVYAFPFGEPGSNRVAVLFDDITDRKRAEDELRESEEKYRQILESMGAGFVVLEAVCGDKEQPIDFTILDVDPAYESVTGSRRDQVIGRRVTEVAPGIGRIWVERCGAGFSTGRLEQFEEYNPIWNRWYGIHVGPMPRKNRCALIFTDITERKRVEEALRESEEKFRALVEHSLDGTLILDPEGNILFANHAAGRLIEIENPDELIGRRNVMEFVAPVSQDDVIKDFGEVAKGIDAYIARYKILTAAQEERWVESIGKSIVFKGAPAILISLRDITERHRAEEAIRQSEKKYRTLFDSAGDAILIHDLDGKLLDVNRVATKHLGYSREELLTMDLTKIVTPEFAALVPERIREVIEKGHTVFETAHVTHEGGRVPIEVSAQLISYRGRTAILSIARDIADRKRAQEALRESEKRFRLLTENASDIVVVLDPEGRIRYASPSVKTVGGYAPDDLIGRNVLELTHPDDLALVLDALRTATAHPKERITLEVRVRHASGYWLYLDVIGTNLLGEPAVRGFLVNARDITDRKRAEEALQRRTDDLIGVSREVEAARDEANMYLDIMTHDIRNANNVSSMYVDLLMDLAEGDLKVYAEKLHASIERSSEILKNVATIRQAAEEVDNLAPVDLDAVIRNEIASFPDASIRYRDAHIEVLADSLLPTIFTNLISNAVKFGGPDVEITVRVEELDGRVLVSVEDTGPGVPDEVKGRLFIRFERGMATGSGQGLGLFIVRTLVERYGGEARVDDRVPGHSDEGAAFRFTLKKAV